MPVSSHPSCPTDPAGAPIPARPLLLQVWLALLAGLAALACVRALVLPPWPHAQPVSPEPIALRLSQVGLDPRRLPSRSMPQAEGLGLSELLAWRLPEVGQLHLVSAHVRRRDDFQVAWITSDLPQLSLSRRRLAAPLPGVASGTIQGRPAYQTCLVSQGPSPAQPAVTLAALQGAVDRQPRTRADRLRSLVGLSRNRELRCLLVTLRSNTAQPPPVQAWKTLITALQHSQSLPAPPPQTGG